jgi:hypothetical protein
MYQSDLFKKCLAYARSLHPDQIFVLSAKYGLLDLHREIDPYDETLNQRTIGEIKQWAAGVIEQLRKISDLEKDRFTFLAADRYRRFLIPHLSHCEIPMRGLGIGKQLQFLKGATQMTAIDICAWLHTSFNRLERFRFPFDPMSIPTDGIYILFEQGEKAHGGDRIVRIGTHTGDSQLRSRLGQHFLVENKDRSIFRKNIGRALLAKAKDPCAADWERDLTTRDSKGKYPLLVGSERIREIEGEVSRYIRANFSFAVFEVREKADRLRIESRIISTVSLCPTCKPSPESTWLGLASPKEKIRKSGLWLVNELFKEPLSTEELSQLKEMLALSV